MICMNEYIFKTNYWKKYKLGLLVIIPFVLFAVFTWDYILLLMPLTLIIVLGLPMYFLEEKQITVKNDLLYTQAFKDGFSLSGIKSIAITRDAYAVNRIIGYQFSEKKNSYEPILLLNDYYSESLDEIKEILVKYMDSNDLDIALEVDNRIKKKYFRNYFYTCSLASLGNVVGTVLGVIAPHWFIITLFGGLAILFTYNAVQFYQWKNDNHQQHNILIKRMQLLDFSLLGMLTYVILISLIYMLVS